MHADYRGYADPTANRAIANIMHDEKTRDAYPQSWAETTIAMLSDPGADTEDISYMLRVLAPQLAA